MQTPTSTVVAMLQLSLPVCALSLLLVQPLGAQGGSRSDPALPSDPGIYLYARGTSGLELVPLEPTTFSQSRRGNGILTSLTYGIAKTRTKAIIRGNAAAIWTTDTLATLYFVFSAKSSGPDGNAWFQSATSPNEFTLIKLRVEKNARSTETGSFNAYGSQWGTNSKAAVPFKFTRLRPGVYRVVPEQPLAWGEYAIFAAAGPAVGGGGTAMASRLYDFGIWPPQ